MINWIKKIFEKKKRLPMTSGENIAISAEALDYLDDFIHKCNDLLYDKAELIAVERDEKDDEGFVIVEVEDVKNAIQNTII